MGIVSTVIAAVCLLSPLYAAGALTVVIGGVYVFFDRWRWTFLLAYRAILLYVPLMGYALARRTFVWGGRRYRWPSKYDGEIVE